VDQRSGGQKRLPFGGAKVSAKAGPTGSEAGLGSAEAANAEGPLGGPEADETGGPQADDNLGPAAGTGGQESEGDSTGPSLSASIKGAALPGGRRSRKRGHFGLRIRFEERPDDPELGRLIESTVWVNTAHPAYVRAVSSRSEGYHLALTVAMTLASLAVEPERAHAFVSSFLRRWGEVSKR
jgi:hypothetical protein